MSEQQAMQDWRLGWRMDWLDPYSGPMPRRTFKDTVFRDLFGKEERKCNALSLYNALAGTSYEDPNELELTTIDNAIYMTHKNDVSFLIGDEMVLWEQQSTRNPNMGLRDLVYVAQLYTKYVQKNHLNIFSTKRIGLPTPRIYVFYSGGEDCADREEQHLSDSFSDGPGDVEIHVHVINVNEGHNASLMEACETLAGYAHLIRLIEDKRDTIGLGNAVRYAVASCIRDGYLADYLRDRQAEVEGMLLSEYDEAETMRLLREEAREDGFSEGRKEGRAEVREQYLFRAVGAVRSNSLSIEQASELFGFTEDEIRSQL